MDTKQKIDTFRSPMHKQPCTIFHFPASISFFNPNIYSIPTLYTTQASEETNSGSK